MKAALHIMFWQAKSSGNADPVPGLDSPGKYIQKAASRIRHLPSGLKRSWEKFQFDSTIHGLTRKNHGKILFEAERSLENRAVHEADDAYAASFDPLVRQGHRLKRRAEQDFRNRFAGIESWRVMIHVPDPAFSPAGYSLFTSLAESLEFLGVPTHILGWNDNVRQAINQFMPTVLLSSDHAGYLERIDWEAVSMYRESNQMKIGLTASLAQYGNTPLDYRLRWARTHGVDFFFSFRDESYVARREEYRLFFDSGYKLLHIPFGANILHYYPVAGIDRDIDFALLASRKKEHELFMKDLVRKNFGFIDGPGWRHAPTFQFNRDRDRYIYARAKVGLNVHLPEQIDWACEVNERTYQLAACGVPQIVDHPRLLDRLFSPHALFVSDTPKQYSEHFAMIINDPAAGQERALNAQMEVFARHTTFHRADSFMRQLMGLDS